MKTMLMLMAVVAALCCAPAEAQFCQDGRCFTGPPPIIYGPIGYAAPVYAPPVMSRPFYVVQELPVITQETAKPQADTGGVIDEPTQPVDPPKPPRPRPDYYFSPQCAPVLIPGPPCHSHCVPTPYRVRRSIGVGLTFHWNSSRR